MPTTAAGPSLFSHISYQNKLNKGSCSLWITFEKLLHNSLPTNSFWKSHPKRVLAEKCCMLPGYRRRVKSFGKVQHKGQWEGSASKGTWPSAMTWALPQDRTDCRKLFSGLHKCNTYAHPHICTQINILKNKYNEREQNDEVAHNCTNLVSHLSSCIKRFRPMNKPTTHMWGSGSCDPLSSLYAPEGRD